DHHAGMRRATEYLIGLGHTRIALITGRPTTRPALERIAGFRSAIRKHKDVQRNAIVRTPGFSADAGFVETSSLLTLPARPTAIIAGGMDMLAGVIRAVQTRNLKIPRDISIIAGADTTLAALTQPPMTAI